MYSKKIEDILNISNKRRELCLSDIDNIKGQKKCNGLHPHNESIFRFINSDYYKIGDFYKLKKIYKNTKNEKEWTAIKESILNENQQNIITQDLIIKNKGVRNIERNDLLPYLDFFNVQLITETVMNGLEPPVMYCRHGEKTGIILDYVEQAFNVIEILVECNKKMDWSDIENETWIWSNHLISLSWGLYEIGLAKYSIKILEPFYETINIFLNNEKLNEDNNFVLSKFFDCDIFGSYPYVRVTNSTSWVLLMSYLQVGDNEKYLNILKSIIDYSKYSNYCYRVNTRHIEAAIRIYKLEENSENLEKLYSIFEKAIQIEPDENSESLMERCVAMYEFLYKIIDGND